MGTLDLMNCTTASCCSQRSTISERSANILPCIFLSKHFFPSCTNSRGKWFTSASPLHSESCLCEDIDVVVWKKMCYNRDIVQLTRWRQSRLQTLLASNPATLASISCTIVPLWESPFPLHSLRTKASKRKWMRGSKKTHSTNIQVLRASPWIQLARWTHKDGLFLECHLQNRAAMGHSSAILLRCCWIVNSLSLIPCGRIFQCKLIFTLECMILQGIAPSSYNLPNLLRERVSANYGLFKIPTFCASSCQRRDLMSCEDPNVVYWAALLTSLLAHLSEMEQSLL